MLSAIWMSLLPASCFTVMIFIAQHGVRYACLQKSIASHILLVFASWTRSENLAP
jgi:hypothetical protein